MGKASWQERWLGEEDALGDLYGEFLEKAEEETARCRWCKCNFNFSHSGITALKHHILTKKHKAVADQKKGRNRSQATLVSCTSGVNNNSITTLGSSATQSSSTSSQGPSGTAPAPAPKIITITDQINKAEAILVMKGVESQWSYASYDNLTECLKAADPRSEVFAKLKLGRHKVSKNVTKHREDVEKEKEKKRKAEEAAAGEAESKKKKEEADAAKATWEEKKTSLEEKVKVVKDEIATQNKVQDAALGRLERTKTEVMKKSCVKTIKESKESIRVKTEVQEKLMKQLARHMAKKPKV